MCCETADEELLQHEAELFDCGTCPVALAQADVWPENLDAWRVFQRLASRLVVDFHLGPELMRKATEDQDAETAGELVERLAVIYDIVMPPQQES